MAITIKTEQLYTSSSGKLSLLLAIVALSIYLALITPAEIGLSAANDLFTAQLTGGEQLSPYLVRSDAVPYQVASSPATLYYSYNDRPGELEYLIELPRPLKELTLDYSGHNNKIIQVEVWGEEVAKVTRSLSQGAIPDQPLHFPELRGQKQVHILVTLVTDPDHAYGNSYLWSLRARAILDPGVDWRGMLLRGLIGVGLMLVLWAGGAWLFAHQAGLPWTMVAFHDMHSAWPLTLLATYPLLYHAHIEYAAQVLLFGVLLLYALFRIYQWMALLEQSQEVDRAALTILACCFILATLVFGKPIVNGDGVVYYAYARSTVVDGDLEFGDEFAEGLPRFYTDVQSPGVTARGFTYTFAPVGVAVFWLPVIMGSHWVGLLLNGLGYSANLDGYSIRYMFPVALTSWLFMFAGVIVSYKVACRWVSPRIALLAALGAWLAGPLFTNAYEFPMFVHAIDFGIASIFTYLALSVGTGRAYSRWFLMGLYGGLMAAVRPQNVLLYSLLLGSLFNLNHSDGLHLLSKSGLYRPYLIKTLMVLGGSMVGYAPQLAFNYSLFGLPIISHKVYTATRIFPPTVWRDLFSAEHGLFYWTPLMLLAVIGLIVATQQKPRRFWAWIMLLAFALQVYLIGLFDYYNPTFSQRYLINCLPIFTLGFGVMLEWLITALKRIPTLQAALFSLVGGFIVWNLNFHTLFVIGAVDRLGKNLTLADLLVKQFTVAPHHWVDHLQGRGINQQADSWFRLLSLGWQGNNQAWLGLFLASVSIVIGAATVAWMIPALIRYWQETNDSSHSSLKRIIFLVALLPLSVAGIWLYLGQIR